MTEELGLIAPGSTDWANDDFFVNIIRKSEKVENVHLVSHALEPACEQGENYLSTLYRATIIYNANDEEEEKTKMFVIKASLQGALFDELSSELDVFKREGTAFKIIIPECEKLLKKIGDPMKFAPKIFSAEETLIVMEDLKAQGFATENRKERLNLLMSEKVIEKLAKFHATSAVLSKENPKIFCNHMTGNLTEVETPYHEFYRNSSATCLKIAKNVAELQPYIANLEEFQKNITSRQINVFTRDETQFNCLNHGDMWTSNLMFKKNDDGSVDEIIFVSLIIYLA